MKLRLILLVLSMLAVLSVAAGGYLYYASSLDYAVKAAQRQSLARVEMIQRNVSSFLSEYIKPARALAGMEELLLMLTRRNYAALTRANAILDHFKLTMHADVCYLMDYAGNTIASSNRNAPDSFVGKNFAFRPYFQQAIHSAPGTYLALGTTSRKRGAYYSYPIFEKGEDIPIGLAVIKVSIGQIEKELGLYSEDIVLVTDPHGVIFISNRKDWLLKTLHPLSEETLEKIRASRQFGRGPWEWTGVRKTGDGAAADRAGVPYIIYTSPIENYRGWQVALLEDQNAISRSVTAPMVRITAPAILSLCVLVGASVVFLYRKASREIIRRKRVERALSESEERYRIIYNKTPAMLHSIDPQGRLVSVSDHWVDVLGYPRETVIGEKLTRYFTEDSRQYAEHEVFPLFFRKGACKDIPYRFIKASGEVMDVMLSAIADRDGDGNIERSLAVSIDVTERNRAEQALKLAKEELDRYSRELEREVRLRTREITSILTYTPAVVYIKDVRGRYSLVNPMFEAVFGATADAVIGKSDYDLFPKDAADRFRANDAMVLEKKTSRQVEERMPTQSGERTYLSVKFPVFDEAEAATGVCSISADITAVKKAQNQLRQLSGAVMANQETERRAIARELHDELGQILTALRMDAVWLRNRIQDADGRVLERISSMCGIIDNAIEEVRGLAIRLRPGVLDELGLVEALEWYTSDFERRTEITCVFEHGDMPVIKDAAATAAYRIAQEALTNVARHAGATSVEMRLKTENAMLFLEVTDNGRGFDPDQLSETDCLGLAGMRERAALIGGELEVRSAHGNGAQVLLRAPIRRPDRSAA